MRRSLVAGLRALIRPGRVERDLDDELRQYLEHATDDYVRDIYRAKEKGKAPGQEVTPAPSSKLSQFFSLVSVAYADDFKVQSAKSEEIKARLRSRLDDLITNKRAGKSFSALIPVPPQLKRFIRLADTGPREVRFIPLEKVPRIYAHRR